MRVQRKRIITAEATGDTARLQTAQIRLHMLDGEYNRFSRAAGLRRMDERIEAAGYKPRKSLVDQKTDKHEFKQIKKIMVAANKDCGGDKDQLIELFLQRCYTKGIERG